MCKYCDEWYDPYELHLLSNVPLQVNGEKLFDVQVSLDMNIKGKPVLSTEVVFGNGNVPDSLRKLLPIRYCPICGNELIIPEKDKKLLEEDWFGEEIES